MSQDISPSELYAIQLENEEPSFYTRIPHILSYLTYDSVDKDGKKVVKKLSLVARELYRVIKMTAGDLGKCWRSTESLAELCGMSAGSVSNAKEELSQSFHQLNGGSLITIKENRRANFKDNKCTNKSPSHTITIKNIWGFNNAFMSTLKFQNKEAGSPNESADEAGSSNESAHQGADSPNERNKNPNKKNPLSKKQQHTAEAESVDSVSSVFYKNKDSVSCEKKVESYEWLIKNGCPQANASAIIKRFSFDDIMKASEYCNNQFDKNRAKGKPLGNKWAYLQNTLNKRYWEKK